MAGFFYFFLTGVTKNNIHKLITYLYKNTDLNLFEYLEKGIIPRFNVLKQTINCLTTCLSLLIREPSLGLLRERIENQLYLTLELFEHISEQINCPLSGLFFITED